LRLCDVAVCPHSVCVCLWAQNPGQPPSKLHSFLAGGAAGVLQWYELSGLPLTTQLVLTLLASNVLMGGDCRAPTYSFDVVKSYMQAAEPGTYRGVLHCAQTLYQTQGLAVFGRGFSACMVCGRLEGSDVILLLDAAPTSVALFGRDRVLVCGAVQLRAFPLHGSIFVFYELTMKVLEPF
jgi:hypothetical protein